MRRGERPVFTGAGNLVHLLVVLFGGEVVVHLSGEGVVGYALQGIGPVAVSGKAKHLFQGEHHLNGLA